MKRVRAIIYRYLTNAEFYNMYKPRGSEERGGGQMYIDFPTREIPEAEWRRFLDPINRVEETQVQNGAKWRFPIHSIGVPDTPDLQALEVYRRREASFCISGQWILSPRANRVRAWHPDHGFPQPENTADRHQRPRGLVIYLVSTYEGEAWAGWFTNRQGAPQPFADGDTQGLIQEMVDPEKAASEGAAGSLLFRDGDLLLDEGNLETPFGTPLTNEVLPAPEAVQNTQGTSRMAPPRQAPVRAPAHQDEAARPRTQHRQRTEDEILDSLFGDDEADADTTRDDAVRETIVEVRQRNTRAVRDLKALYNNECQITGRELTFQKKGGAYYCEAHHLIPLGVGGADDPRNIIIVSPLIHRMLHYADVSEIDLARAEIAEDGWTTLQIEINREPYTIKWHPEHGRRVLGE